MYVNTAFVCLTLGTHAGTAACCDWDAILPIDFDDNFCVGDAADIRNDAVGGCIDHIAIVADKDESAIDAGLEPAGAAATVVAGSVQTYIGYLFWRRGGHHRCIKDMHVVVASVDVINIAAIG